MTEETHDDGGTARPTMRGLGRSMHSRRHVVAALGAVLGTGVLGSTGAAAQAGGDDVLPPINEPGTDVDVLNYALTLEVLEAEFYAAGLSAFDVEDFVESPSFEWDEAEAAMVRGNLATIGDHEQTHVDQLTRAIEVLGGEPADPTFEVDLASVRAFVALAQVLENTGVAAYAGVAPHVESPDVLSAALSIHSVEARHAAYLNQLNDESPFPQAFDAAASPDEVLSAIRPFVPEEETETPTETESPTATETDTTTPTETDAPTPTDTETATQTETVTEPPTTEVPDNGTSTPGNETETTVPGNVTDTASPDTVTETVTEIIDTVTGSNGTNGS